MPTNKIHLTWKLLFLLAAKGINEAQSYEEINLVILLIDLSYLNFFR